MSAGNINNPAHRCIFNQLIELFFTQLASYSCYNLAVAKWLEMLSHLLSTLVWSKTKQVLLKWWANLPTIIIMNNDWKWKWNYYMDVFWHRSALGHRIIQMRHSSTQPSTTHMEATGDVLAAVLLYKWHTNTLCLPPSHAHIHKHAQWPEAPALGHSGGLMLMTGSVAELNCTAGPSCPVRQQHRDREEKFGDSQ